MLAAPTVRDIAALPAEARAEVLDGLSDEEAAALLYDWRFVARPAQLEPEGGWQYWLILAGRGFGKTRTGAEMVRKWARDYSLVNLIGATADDARDIMIEGESGILAICPPDERPEYIKHARRLDWPSGAKSLIFTADQPDRLRGKQHEKLWPDEIASWRYPEAWDQAIFGLRLGDNPQAVITTTPRPTKLIKELKADPLTVVTSGSTYDNRANLAPAFLNKLIKKYEGTRLGKQELYAEILDDNPAALWKRKNIDDHRALAAPNLARIAVAVDPQGSVITGETGIVGAGRAGNLSAVPHFYVLEDASLSASPEGWGRAAVTLYHKLGADVLVAERNFGGDMVEATIRTIDPTVNVKVVTASRGKTARAEPIAALYEQGRGHHVGTFPLLEDELTQWEPGMDSPNRLDALVWAGTELMLTGSDIDMRWL